MKTNLVLIGMPGSGKTTFGHLLSEHLQMNFIDTDDYIEESSGKKISELFIKGEDYFRDIETQTCHTLGNYNNHVISTGGGVIKRKQNIESLKKQGVILFIDRPIEEIAKDVETSTRPLLAEGNSKLEKLYQERIALYQQYSDIHIFNSGNISETMQKILNSLPTSLTERN